MKTTIYGILGLFILGSLSFSACSSRRINKEMASNQETDPKIIEGHNVFKQKCQSCHPNGESGVGPEITNTRVPKFLLKVRVRSRAFLLYTGRMPAFDKHEISPKELSSLVYYVKSLQRNEKPGDKKEKAGK